MYCLL